MSKRKEGDKYFTNARHQIPTGSHVFLDFSLGVGLCWNKEMIKHPGFLATVWTEGLLGPQCHQEPPLGLRDPRIQGPREGGA